MPRIGPVRDFLSTGFGRLIALLVIVYTWKYVSALVAVLLIVAFVRCTTSVWEGLETQSNEPQEVQGKAVDATCPAKTTFDVATQMCKGEDGKGMVLPLSVRCIAGYKPNAAGNRCVQTKLERAPPPPPPAMPAPSAASSATTATAEAITKAISRSEEARDKGPGAPVESFVPGIGTIATTPGVAQEKARNTVVLQQQGGAEPFTLMGAGYPLR